MRKLSRSAYEDTKGLLRVAETWLEIAVMTLLYYAVWKEGYELYAFAYKGKYVLMGVYALLTYLFFQNSDCSMFGQLHRVDLVIGQIIALLLVNVVTYFQLCLIGETVLDPMPILILFLMESVVAALLIWLFTWMYHRLYAPHNMLMVYGNKRSVELKIKMDSRRDKYHISKLISADLGFEAIKQEIAKYDAVILNDVPAQL